MKASLAPIVVALLMLVSLGLLGLIVGLWPKEVPAATPQYLRDQTASSSPGSLQGDCFTGPPRNGLQAKWM